MKRILLSATMFLATVMAVIAQNIEYNAFTHEVLFTVTEDGEREYIKNAVEISLPVSSDQPLPLDVMKSEILSSSFVLLDDHVTNKLTSVEAVKELMASRNLSNELPDENMRQCSSIPEDAMSMGVEVKVVPQCINNGILTMCCETYFNGGGVHGSFLVSYFYLDLKTGKLISNDKLLTNSQKKAALRLLTTAANVRKFHGAEDFSYSIEDAKEIAEGIRALKGNVEYFPPFYIDNGRLHMMFQQYAVCSYAMGMPEFSIPLSLLNTASTMPVKRPAARPAARKTVRR